jgi:hypothetical protein
MKIFHFLNLDQYLTSIGIVQKSFKQISLWRLSGHSVKFVCIYATEKEKTRIQSIGDCHFIKRVPQKFVGQNRVSRCLGLVPTHEAILLKEIVEFDPNIVYHRTFEISSFISKITKRFPSVIEINGNEFSNLKKGKSNPFFLERARILFFKRFIKKFLGQHKGIVFVTHELLHIYKEVSKLPQLEAKSCVIPNGIDVSEYKMRKNGTTGSEKPRLVFIGTPQHPWHGIEIILVLAERTKEELEFHVIGEHFKDKQNLPNNLKSYGYLETEEYRDLIANCDIGIGTLALNNAGIEEASPLKVREYVAAGLPIIIGYNDTAFIGKELPKWVLQLPSSTSELLKDIGEIVRFCIDNKDFVVPKEEAKSFFSIEKMESKRLCFFEEITRSYEISSSRQPKR